MVVCRTVHGSGGAALAAWSAAARHGPRLAAGPEVLNTVKLLVPPALRCPSSRSLYQLENKRGWLVNYRHFYVVLLEIKKLSLFCLILMIEMFS